MEEEEEEEDDDDESGDEEEYVIDSILEERTHKGKMQYLVSWQGYDDQTWEPAASLAKTQALVDWKEQQGACDAADGGDEAQSRGASSSGAAASTSALLVD